MKLKKNNYKKKLVKMKHWSYKKTIYPPLSIFPTFQHNIPYEYLHEQGRCWSQLKKKKKTKTTVKEICLPERDLDKKYIALQVKACKHNTLLPSKSKRIMNLIVETN